MGSSRKGPGGNGGDTVDRFKIILRYLKPSGLAPVEG